MYNLNGQAGRRAGGQAGRVRRVDAGTHERNVRCVAWAHNSRHTHTHTHTSWAHTRTTAAVAGVHVVFWTSLRIVPSRSSES